MTGTLQTALFVEGLGVDCPKQSVGIRQVGRIPKECRGIFDQRACQSWRLTLRLSQAQPRQSEEKEGGIGRGKEESVRPRDEAPRGGVQEERAAAAPASASDAAETEPSAKRTRGGRHSSKRVLCCQEGCEQVRSDSKMPRMRGRIERSFSKACSQ